MKKQQIVHLIGIGMGNEETLTQEAKDLISQCDCIIGAKRMTEMYTDSAQMIKNIYMPIEIKEFLKNHNKYQKIAILLSGDTGFYSGAQGIAKELKDFCDVHYIPGISSVVYLAAKLKTSWEDAKLVSVHGRKQNYIHMIAYNRKVFLLLGNQERDKGIREELLQYGLGEVDVWIGNHLSYQNEQIIHKKGKDLQYEDFANLAIAMFENANPKNRTGGHIRDEEFERGKVPMTKEEVRTVSIAKLHLTEDAVLYDVGAGTGSISMEAALRSERMRVYAIEKNPEGIELIHKNRKKFCTDQVSIIEGMAPEVFEQLEAPTHVFIGGSSGNLKSIIKAVKEKNPGVKIVMNAISMETVMEIMDAEKEGLLSHVELTQMMVAKSKQIGSYHMMNGQNPIYIVTEGEVV